MQIQLTLVLAALTMTIAFDKEALARPLLFRTPKVPCDLSIDGGQVGSIGDSYFLRVDTVPGDHIVQCTGTLNLTVNQSQNSQVLGLPYSISTTVSIANAPEQAIIDLPDPIINFDDVVRILGSRYFTATAESTDHVLGPDCSANKFQDKVNSFDDQIADANHRVWNHKLDDTLQDIACSGDDQKECDKAYRNVIDHINDAQDDEKLARSRRSAAVSAEIEFRRRLATEAVAVFAGPPATCDGLRFAKIWFDRDTFLVPVGFVIRSDPGGAFHVR